MKQRTLLFFLLAFAAQIAHGQLYTTTDAYIHFFSEAPLEDIEAESNQTKGLLNTSNNEVAFMAKINAFQFDKELMREHFNENYMESHKFPNAKFVGTIVEDIDYTNPGTYEVTVDGKLTIHGVTKPRKIKGTLTVKDGQIIVEAKFQVKLVDHDIEIPSVVMQNIAEVIDVNVKFELKPKS